MPSRKTQVVAKPKTRPKTPSPRRPRRRISDEIREVSKSMLLDPLYLKNLQERLRAGKVQPGVEVALMYFAFGKPPDTVQTKQIAPVRIVHEYADDTRPLPTVKVIDAEPAE